MEQAAKHTPGPWQVNHTKPYQVCDASDVRGCAPIANVKGSGAERIANAQLIAAAPELLACLQNLCESLRREPMKQTTRLCYTQARDAIDRSTNSPPGPDDHSVITKAA